MVLLFAKEGGDRSRGRGDPRPSSLPWFFFALCGAVVASLLSAKNPRLIPSCEVLVCCCMLSCFPVIGHRACCLFLLCDVV
jgi:hypothetical protein